MVTRGWQVDEGVRASVIAAHELETLRGSDALRRVTDFAAALCDAPVGLVTVIGETLQTFLASTGTDLTETPRDISFCRFVIQGDGLMVVPDATMDARFADNPLVTGEMHIRFYAGMPLITDDGVAIGSLCVLDTEPHPQGLTPLQRQGLETLAAAVVDRMRDSRDAAAWRETETESCRRVVDSEQRFRTLADAMPQMVWSTLPDGFHDYYNARWYDFTGTSPGSTDGEAWNTMFHPDDQGRARVAWAQSLATGEPYGIEYRLRHRDGGYRWVLGRALPLRDEAGAITRWFGTCTDVNIEKLLSEEREVVSQELSHRIKNIFSVIAGLVGFTARGKPEFAALANDLRDRITALGRAHDFVRPHSLHSVPVDRQDSLKGLLATLFEPYQRRGGGVVVDGTDVAIDDRSATPLALLFHELATNATKYGALSVADGQVTVTIAAEDDLAIIDWREQGGPTVAEPEATGFGSQLVEMSAVRQLGGEVTRQWREEGLRLSIKLPRASLHR